MILKGTVFFLLVCILSCNTKTKQSWTKADQDLFRESCIVNSREGLGEARSRSYCDCMLKKVEAKYPNADEAGKITTAETKEMANECLENLPPADKDSVIN